MHRGRLPGAVGPEEAGHVAGADGEAQIFDTASRASPSRESSPGLVSAVGNPSHDLLVAGLTDRDTLDGTRIGLHVLRSASEAAGLEEPSGQQERRPLFRVGHQATCQVKLTEGGSAVRPAAEPLAATSGFSIATGDCR